MDCEIDPFIIKTIRWLVKYAGTIKKDKYGAKLNQISDCHFDLLFITQAMPNKMNIDINLTM